MILFREKMYNSGINTKTPTIRINGKDIQKNSDKFYESKESLSNSRIQKEKDQQSLLKKELSGSDIINLSLIAGQLVTAQHILKSNN